MNAVITISVISVANSCTFGSTRTMQAMAADGMGPKFLAYVDNKGRPVWCVAVQLAFGLLAFVQEAHVGSTVFTWLLALSGLSYFFVWGSICLCHIRFRAGWKAQGHSLDELPFRAGFGVTGSWIGFILCCLAICATFYTSIWVCQLPARSPPFLATFPLFLLFFSNCSLRLTNFLSLAPRRVPGRPGLLPELFGRTHHYSNVCILEALQQR